MLVNTRKHHLLGENNALERNNLRSSDLNSSLVAGECGTISATLLPVEKDGRLFQSAGLLSNASSGESQASHMDETCPTCGRPCKSTAVLPCKHFVCLSCVAKTYSVQDPNALSRNELTCPLCQSVSTVSTGLRSLLISSSLIPEERRDGLLPRETKTRAAETPPVSHATPLARAMLFCARCRKGIASTKVAAAEGAASGAVYCCTCFEFYCHTCSDQLHQPGPSNAFSRHRVKVLQVDEYGVNRVIKTADFLETEDVPKRVSGKAERKADAGWRSERLAGEGTASELSAIDLSCPDSWHLRSNHAVVEDYQCLSHPGEPVQFRCVTCQSMAVCAQCCVITDVHKGHTVLPLKRAFEEIQYQIVHTQRTERESAKLRLRTLLQRAERVGSELENTMSMAAINLDEDMKSIILEMEVWH